MTRISKAYIDRRRLFDRCAPNIKKTLAELLEENPQGMVDSEIVKVLTQRSDLGMSLESSDVYQILREGETEKHLTWEANDAGDLVYSLL